ncbi:MAG: VPLPA-CTERM sorting domain-containing protein, partial [Sulfitobacter pontiacus]|uniref:VPLPA-CTERM sorting domain-containing protein n=1 Tax=Sulfitobacter pontiacus TaxID=60137 RepID=UPI0032635D79
FALKTEGTLFYTYYREPNLPDGSLPFVTNDGAFRVINGGILNFDASDPSIISGNTSLPVIGAEYALTTVPTVPLPAGGVLMLTALGAGAALGRRRRTS